MLRQRHHDTASEILIALNHPDIRGTKAGHTIEVRRDGRKTCAGVERGVVRDGSRAISGSKGRAKQVDRLLVEFLCALLGYQHESCRAAYAAAFPEVAAEKITHAMVVPTMLGRILDVLDEIETARSSKKIKDDALLWQGIPKIPQILNKANKKPRVRRLTNY